MIDIDSILHISKTEQLAPLLPKLEEASRIAIDTEADSLHHYFEKVCLLQVSVPGVNAIIDPLEGIDLSSLLEVLARKPLIIQGADYDLRMMKRDYDFNACHIFDTMLAAQILGYERFSYAALVEKHTEVVLSKHGQKADWSQRPLPEKLITYAAADTHYLLTVADRLEEELQIAGRSSWLDECCVRLLNYVSNGMRPPDPEKQWRVKGWHTLRPGKGWAYLREMWKWRDSEAQKVDYPPFKIMRNESLIEIAKWAQDGFSPKEMPKIPKNINGRRRREMDNALATAREMPSADWPKPLETTRRSLPALDDILLNEIKFIRDTNAADFKLDPGFLLSTASIATITAAQPKEIDKLKEVANLFQWQTDLMGTEIVDAVKGKRLPKPVKLQAADLTVAIPEV